jgi:hypothetical protein
VAVGQCVRTERNGVRHGIPLFRMG